MPIYEKPTRELMHEFAAERLRPGQVFSRNDAIQWFAERYPKIKSNTVGMHVDGMSINARVRRHHKSIKPNAGFDLFYKLGPSQFRLWDQSQDPLPLYRDDPETATSGEALDPEDAANEETAVGAATFAFERDLQNYLVKNLHLIEPGLRLYEDEDGQFNGVEYPVGGRYIDILAVSASGTYVVIETKVSRAYDRVIGQVLRYMAWISRNLADGAPVRGVIIASEISEDLVLAASLAPGISLVEYEISFSVKPARDSA